MKILTIKTIRAFKDNKEYEDYKATVKEFIHIDWSALEDEGSVYVEEQRGNERVITSFELS